MEVCLSGRRCRGWIGKIKANQTFIRLRRSCVDAVKLTLRIRPCLSSLCSQCTCKNA